jgi:hypothetical protein
MTTTAVTRAFAVLPTSVSNPVLQLEPGEQVRFQTLEPDTQVIIKALPNSCVVRA